MPGLFTGHRDRERLSVLLLATFSWLVAGDLGKELIDSQSSHHIENSPEMGLRIITSAGTPNGFAGRELRVDPTQPRLGRGGCRARW